MIKIIEIFTNVSNWYINRKLSAIIATSLCKVLGVFIALIGCGVAIKISSSDKGNFYLALENTASSLGRVELIIFFGLVCTILVCLSINVWENLKTKDKEFIGIKHLTMETVLSKSIKEELNIIDQQFYREIEVNHSALLDNSNEKGITEALNLTEQILIKLRAFLEIKPDSYFAYYGIAHVPLSFYLGYILSEFKQNILVFEFNNKEQKWNQLSGHSTIKIKNNKEIVDENCCEMIIKISVSFSISDTLIETLNIFDKHSVYSMEVENIEQNSLRSHEDIKVLQREFRKILDEIHGCPQVRKIHIFYAGPNSLSFSLGRIIKKNIDKEFVIYNYTQGNYKWALSFNNKDKKCKYINLENT